jgi:hypothetical protein
VAFAAWFDLHERTALALVAAGALAPADLTEALRAFEVGLAEAPESAGAVVDVEQYQLRKALGVA